MFNLPSFKAAQPVQQHAASAERPALTSSDVNEAAAATPHPAESDLHQLVAASGVVGLVIDPQMRLLRFTPNMNQIVGLTPEDVGRPVNNALAHLSGCNDLMQALQSVLDTGETAIAQVQTLVGRWFEARIRPHHQPDRHQHGAVVAFMDTSALMQAQSALQASEMRYQSLVDWFPEAINILRHGVFIYVNPVAVRAYGANSPQDLLGTPSRERVHPDDLPAALERLTRVTRDQVGAPLVEMRFIRLDGSVMDVQTQATSIDYEGEPAIHVAWRDITRQKHVEAQQLDNQARVQRADEVLHLAFHDDLTKLPNRRVLNDRLGQAMLSSLRTGCYGALMFLDLDNFKPLNDSHGHGVGDLLLVEVARRLMDCVRATDTVARFGGDEFVVMLGQLSTDRSVSVQQALGLAEKIRMALAQPYQLTVPSNQAPGPTFAHVCTTSIGVAMFIHNTTPQDEILKWADTAMYQAKKSGRNSICLHESAADWA